MFGLLLAIAAPALAAEPAGALTDRALVEAIQTYQRHAELPLPLPGPKRRAQLLSGKLVRMRLPSAEGQPVGAMALQITDLSLAELWIGTVDEDMGGADEVLSHHMPRTGGEMFRWYGYVDMPSPVTDRHFLIQTTVNTQLHLATKGQMWARHWRMEPGGEAMRAEVARGAKSRRPLRGRHLCPTTPAPGSSSTCRAARACSATRPRRRWAGASPTAS